MCETYGRVYNSWSQLKFYSETIRDIMFSNFYSYLLGLEWWYADWAIGFEEFIYLYLFSPCLFVYQEVGMPADYVNKLARMFQDIKVSEDLNQEFKDAHRNNNEYIAGMWLWRLAVMLEILDVSARTCSHIVLLDLK